MLLWYICWSIGLTRATRSVFHTVFSTRNTTESLTLFKCDQTRSVCAGAFWENQYLGFKEKESKYIHIIEGLYFSIGYRKAECLCKLCDMLHCITRLPLLSQQKQNELVKDAHSNNNLIYLGDKCIFLKREIWGMAFISSELWYKKLPVFDLKCLVLLIMWRLYILPYKHQESGLTWSAGGTRTLKGTDAINMSEYASCDKKIMV